MEEELLDRRFSTTIMNKKMDVLHQSDKKLWDTTTLMNKFYQKELSQLKINHGDISCLTLKSSSLSLICVGMRNI